jgi:predicted Zn-dependent protease
MLAQAALGQNPGVVEQIVAQVGGAGILAAHTRSEEREADHLGLEYLVKAQYDPKALTDFFGTLAEKSGGRPGAIASFFASHPPPQDRQQYLSAAIRQMGNPTGRTGADRHAQALQRLRSYYAARGVPIG